jgi:hypothetical protein
MNIFLKILRNLLLIFLIASCSSNQEYESFPEPTSLFSDKQIKLNKISTIEGIQLNTPIQLLVVDTLLFVHDQFEIDDQLYFFRAINPHEKTVVQTFGREGRGPDEFMFPAFMSRVPGSKNSIGINNRRLFSYSQIRIDNISDQNSKLSVLRVDELNTDYSLVGKGCDDLFFGTGFFNGGRYATSDSSGELVNVFGEYPFEENFSRMDRRDLGMAYQSMFRIHPEKCMVATITHSSANLEILLVENSEVQIIKKIHLNYPLFENESTSQRLSISIAPENRRGYQDIDVSTRNIYTLYSGIIRSEGLRKYRSGDIVLVYDWEGNPKKSYSLDKPAVNIAVSEDDRFLYTISVEDDGTNGIVIYDLKNS